MAFTKAIIYSGVLNAGNNTGALPIAYIPVGAEVLIMVQCSTAAGSSTLRLENAVPTAFHQAVYGAAGGLDTQSGYYIAAGNDFNTVTAYNSGATNFSNLVITAFLNYDGNSRSQIIPTQNMFNKEDIIRLIEINTGKTVIGELEPHTFRWTSSIPAIKENYIYFGQIDINSLGLGMTTLIRVRATLVQAQSPNLYGNVCDLQLRNSYDGIVINQLTRTNCMFNKFINGDGTFEAYFVGYRIKVE